MQERDSASQMSPHPDRAVFGQPPLQQQPRRDVDRQQQQSGSQEYQPRQVQAGRFLAAASESGKKFTLKPEARSKTDG